MRRIAALAAALLLGAGPVLAEPRPVGLRPGADTIEGGLWGLFDKAEREAQNKADRNNDPALNAYVRDVACKVTAEYCNDVRVYVLDRPFFNAAMAPNGYTEVWSGALLRCADEAELAFILGHETSHFVENHSIEQHQADKTRANVALALSVGVAVLGAAAAASATDASGARSIMDSTGHLIDLIYLGRIAAYFAFSRQSEAEADRLGLARAAAAGYQASAGAASWRALMAETAASDFERVRKGQTRASIFDSHPLGTERIAALEAQARSLPTTGETGRERYRAAIRPHLAAWLRDDLRRRDFGTTLHLIDRLALPGEDLGVLNFYRGEAYRQRRKDGDLAQAAKAYEVATRYADVPVAAWRELGDIRKRDGDNVGARAAYEAYLNKASDADDAWLVRDALASMPQGA